MERVREAAYRHLGPLFFVACACYFLNRINLSLDEHASPFLRGHFNDIFTVPAMYPPLMIWTELTTKTIKEPSIKSVLIWCAIWSVMFEWLFPHFGLGTSDPVDVLCYFGGAAVFIVLDVMPRQGWFNRTIKA